MVEFDVAFRVGIQPEVRPAAAASFAVVEIMITAWYKTMTPTRPDIPDNAQDRLTDRWFTFALVLIGTSNPPIP